MSGTFEVYAVYPRKHFADLDPIRVAYTPVTTLSLAGTMHIKQESILGITTNIESQELRGLENNSYGKENPWAGTTDDMECFFSLSIELQEASMSLLNNLRFCDKS